MFSGHRHLFEPDYEGAVLRVERLATMLNHQVIKLIMIAIEKTDQFCMMYSQDC